MPDPLPLFLVAPPGLEPVLAAEAREKGFADPQPVPGGVETSGDWPEIWRANLALRGAARVLVRFAEFRAMHLAQLDKRARKLDWGAVLRPDRPVRVEATCRKSRIYHAGAAAQRVSRAITETLGCPVSDTAEIVVKLRIDDDLCTISLDSTGEALHKRGHKPAVGKAPMRENLAALFLRQCGFTGSETVVDPMCGSGTFVIEAAEVASGLFPGRSRRFAFEQLAGFQPEEWEAMKAGARQRVPQARFFGHDRDAGAIRSSTQNAARAGVGAHCAFACQPISALEPPPGAPGIVIVNPPYGARIGNRKALFSVYGALGQVLRERFAGWRVGLVTSDGGLAKATGLTWDAPGPAVAHGGLKVTLWQARLGG